MCEVIAAGIEQHAVKEAARVVHVERFARTDLLVQIQQAFVHVSRGILGKACSDQLALAEHVLDLRVGAHAEGADQHRHRNFPGTVHADPEHVVRVHLVFEPCAAVRDHLTGVQGFAVLVMVFAEIDARGTDQLADDDTLGAVDDKGTGLGHQRHVAHEDDVFANGPRFFIDKVDLHLKRGRIGGVPFLTLFNCVFGFIFTQLEIGKFQTEVAAEVRDRGDVLKCLFQAFVQKPVIGLFLDLDEVRDLQDFLLSRVAHAHVFTGLDRAHCVFLHRRFTSKRYVMP